MEVFGMKEETKENIIWVGLGILNAGIVIALTLIVVYIAHILI